MRKKILVISEAHLIKTFVLASILRIKEETGSRFDCFITTTVDDNVRNELLSVFENVFVNPYPKGFIKKIPKLRVLQGIWAMKRMARNFSNYDVIHFHFYYYYYALLISVLRRKTKLLFITFFGSDFMRINNFRHFINKKVIGKFDGVFAINEVMLNNVRERYLIKHKPETDIMVLLMSSFIAYKSFLSSNTPESTKASLSITKKALVCGYSAAALMQHEHMIDALTRIEDKLKPFKVIFPMTYGWRGEEIRTRVRNKLQSTSLDWTILEDYMNTGQVHTLRLATDIFINLPETDQLAASLMEHLTAGNVVITGTWLPYQYLKDKGIYFVSIDNLAELPTVLSEVIENLDYHRHKSEFNRDIILKMMSWDNIKLSWYKYYRLGEAKGDTA